VPLLWQFFPGRRFVVLQLEGEGHSRLADYDLFVSQNFFHLPQLQHVHRGWPTRPHAFAKAYVVLQSALSVGVMRNYHDPEKGEAFPAQMFQLVRHLVRVTKALSSLLLNFPLPAFAKACVVHPGSWCEDGTSALPLYHHDSADWRLFFQVGK
jgi:hypothetical protein